MKIFDKDILAEFGMSVPKKGKTKGFTPAEISKKYDINKYKQILLNPDSDKTERETAETMIQNYNLKLGKLALVQESSKGFPQSIPLIAMPYLESIGADPSMFGPQGEGPLPSDQPQVAAYGAGVVGDPQQYSYRQGGENRAMAKRFPGLNVMQRGGQFQGAFWDSIMQNGGPVDEASYYNGNDFFNGQPTQEMTSEELDQANEFMRGPRRRSLSDLIPNNLPPDILQNELEYNTEADVLDKFNEIMNRKSGNTQTMMKYTENADPKLYQEIKNKMGVGEAKSNVVEAFSTKPTAKSNLPKDAVVHTEGSDKYNESQIKAGEYVRRKDGKLYKVNINQTLTRASKSGAAEYKSALGSKEEDFKKAHELIDKYKKTGVFKTDKDGKLVITRDAKNIPLEDKDFLTKVFSHGTEDGKIGMPGVKIKQSAVTKENPKGEPFFGFVDPELIEYRYWKARNQNKPASDYSKLDPEEQIANRKSFLSEVGNYTPEQIAQYEKEGKLVDPGALYTEDFMKGSEDNPGFTERNQKFFGGKDFRPGEGNDFKFGLEHVDDYSFGKKYDYTEVPEEGDPKSDIPTADNLNYINQSQDAPWWAQDWGNMMMTVGERAGINKTLPWSQQVNLADPDVLYYDRSRALAANAEQSNLAMQNLSAFAGPQAASARMSGVYGQAFANAANTLADYENKNVGIGNQYLDKVQSTENQERAGNAQRLQTLYDQNTIADQQFANSKTAANRNIFDAWRQGLTNATETQSMNLLYPQYQVDPWRSGITHFTQGRDFANYSPTGSGASDQNEAYFKEHARLKEKYPNIDDKVIAERLSGNFNITNPSSVNSNLNRFVGDTRGTRNKAGRRFS